MPKKDPFRGPGALRFQLVHRSQRDPLIHDSEASQNILKPIPGKQGKQPSTIDASEFTSGNGPRPDRSTLGEAVKYGIYFDDSEYDYMKHLRAVGEESEGVDSVLIEVPTRSKRKEKAMTLKDPSTADGGDIPSEFLPPKVELPKDYETQRNIPSSISGFRPDINPHLRQTLEALDDDAFVDGGIEENFFDELLADGEAAGEEEVDFPFEEEGIDEDTRDDVGPSHTTSEDKDGEWEALFKKFKKEQERSKRQDADDLSSDGFPESEAGDTIGDLPHMSVVGVRKRRKKAGSESSGYSMSSSSMYRNEGLTLLDERFDRVFEKEYENAHPFDCLCPACEDTPDRPKKKRPAQDGAPDQATEEADDTDGDRLHSRDDFDSIMDEFLTQFEVLGGQLRPVLEGQTPEGKLETLRKTMAGSDIAEEAQTKEIIKRLVEMQEDRKRAEVEAELVPDDVDDVKERWDCETILSTYSNLENHPRVIRARDTRKVVKIRLDAKTGFPIVEDGDKSASNKLPTQPPRNGAIDRTALLEEIHGERNDENTPIQFVRARNESKEDKTARKQAAKAEKQARRVEKKATKESFAQEKQIQLKAQLGRVQGGQGLKKL